jgi:uncharacterized membrane protein YqhA
MISLTATDMTEPEPSPPFEKTLQRLLLNSRFAVLIAVAVSLLVGMGMFLVATVDAAFLVVPVVTYPFAHSNADHEVLRNHVVTHIVEVVDGYLLASAMLIFAFGLYTLFISPITDSATSRLPGGVLLVRTFDDLKDRLAKVVILILIVKFFEHALEMQVEHPLDLLWMALAIALVALAVALSHGKAAHDVAEAITPSPTDAKPSETHIPAE